MGLISWIVFGLIAGAVARVLVPSGKGGRDLGCIGTVLLGVVGSLIGGTVANLIDGEGIDFAASGFVGSVLGACGLLVLARVLSR
ncbi:MAG: GlsB/YeaQ/YmgE family stress response membrane protein [Microthrixaceae bacterium]